MTHQESVLVAFAQPTQLDRTLDEFSRRACEQANDAVPQQMRALMAAGLDKLPAPGRGETLRRWQMLAKVAAADLSLLKLYEAHTDARAILQELGASDAATGLWAVWAAEPPQARVEIATRNADCVTLCGRKAWCSGALHVDHALMTVWDEQDRSQLVALALNQPGVTVTREGWQAVGMAAAASFEIHLDGASALCIGEPGAYTARPGFWHGGAGIAACWYGAGVAIARHVQRNVRDDPHSLAHLGALDTALSGARQALYACASWIDKQPSAAAEYPARLVRAQVEAALDRVMRHAGRALGAAPFCRDPHFARLLADLPVFLRQSHAERDLERLGELRLQRGDKDWNL
ncbi:acyl-CoA dehydrogenase [Pseudomonas sp. EA_35y_Pfl2_R111]|uniref:acyl-CoA dehydrogenase n=1 Tax=Pseudomonas sp. EA_35y_Pfl2_R111 TaxID=3088689 RepID=UPI00403F027A